MPLRISQSAASPIPAPWLPLNQAAAKLGVSPGHLRRQCGERYERDGLARKFGGEWAVHPQADPLLRDIESHAQRDQRQRAGLLLQGVSARHLDAAELKVRIIEGLSGFAAQSRGEHAQRAEYIAHLFASGVLPSDGVSRCSITTLYAWDRAYRADGLAGLVRAARAASTGDGSPPPPPTVGALAWDYFRNLLLAGNNLRVATCWTLTRGEATRHPDDPAGWAWPALRTIQVKAQQEIPHAARVYANKGLRAFTAQCLPKARRAFADIPAGDVWCGDERTLDIMCRVPSARGWRRCREVKLTAWMDIRSRVFVGWVIDARADSNTILAALKRGITAHGKPRSLLVDWGRDYRKAAGHIHTKKWQIDSFDGPRVAGVLDRLGIQVDAATPYTPWAKPIESTFGKLKEHFDKLFAAFWGGSPAERHEARDKWCRDNIEKLPTLDDVRKVFAEFAAGYHATPHGGDGMFGKCPSDALAAFRDGPARMESESVLSVLFLDYSEPKVVHRDGIRHLNQWYGHGDARLVAMQGQRIILGVDVDDITRAMVCDEKQIPQFWIEASDLRFRTKTDAERFAKMRARLRRPYAADVAHARELLLDTTPAELAGNARRAASPAADGAPEVLNAELWREVNPDAAAPLRIVTARPDLEHAIALAGPPPAALERVSNDDEPGVELSDLVGFDDVPPAPRAAANDEEEMLSLEEFLGD